ncbi:MAG TPA: pilus assembly protein TadG-related protein [Albidovulum sp.]|uniref:pilus assembly protein TadG-related protein n=1 Tax=Albidovulum sp. TaxID=1872424 RepID=UPI002C0FB0A8|nr:pilus assembly protein TadG-related protein [Albidovulum sp.]
MACQRIREFSRDSEGAMGVWGLILFFTICVIVGLSMDVSNAFKVRSEMQVAADAAAHAALVTRVKFGREQAIQKALAVANTNLSTQKGSTGAIKASDIVFGKWDKDKKVFTPDPNSISAVMVNARRNSSRANGVETFLLSSVGLKSWDVSTNSVMETYRPGCLTEGFVAENMVDIQSNNGFEAGFCIHSNGTISINQNNTFDAGTIVSLPDTDNLQIAASGFVKNNGLLEALRESFYKIRVLNRITDIITALKAGDLNTLKQMKAADPGSAMNYITAGAPISVNTCNLTMSNLTQGRIHIVYCGSTLKPSGAFAKVAIVTSAPVQFSSGTSFEDAVIATSSTDAQSFKGPSGQNNKITFGANDGCTEGGGVQLVTLGGAKFAAGLNMYGSQILAAQTINFAANADGVEGVSLVSADTVSGTSNMKMGYCGKGMDANFEVDYYRLAY